MLIALIVASVIGYAMWRVLRSPPIPTFAANEAELAAKFNKGVADAMATLREYEDGRFGDAYFTAKQKLQDTMVHWKNVLDRSDRPEITPSAVAAARIEAVNAFNALDVVVKAEFARLEATAQRALEKDVGEFQKVSALFELTIEIAKWRTGITLDDPNDERSVVPPGHRILDLAAELASIARAAGDQETSDRLWDAAGSYDTVHAAQLAEIDRYERVVKDFEAGKVDAATGSYLRGKVIEHFEKLEVAWKAFGGVYREALKQHGAALEAARATRRTA